MMNEGFLEVGDIVKAERGSDDAKRFFGFDQKFLGDENPVGVYVFDRRHSGYLLKFSKKRGPGQISDRAKFFYGYFFFVVLMDVVYAVVDAVVFR